MTITYGSILEMRIRKVKEDADDWTLSIPSAILPGLNADSIQIIGICQNLFNFGKLEMNMIYKTTLCSG